MGGGNDATDKIKPAAPSWTLCNQLYNHQVASSHVFGCGSSMTVTGSCKAGLVSPSVRKKGMFVFQTEVCDNGKV